MQIGKNITKFRKEKKLTQEELARLINVSPKTISSYENNRNLPNIETLILLSEALNVKIDDILGSKKEELQEKYEKKTNTNLYIIISITIYSLIYFFLMNYIISGSLILTNMTLSMKELLILLSKYSIFYIISIVIIFRLFFLENQNKKLKLITYISYFIVLIILSIVIFC